MSTVWPAQLTAQANVCMPAPAVLVIAYGYTELSQVYLDTLSKTLYFVTNHSAVRV